MSLVRLETFRGDAFNITGKIKNKDITAWEIRTEIWDNNASPSGVLGINFIRKATANVTGGAGNQVLITDGPNGLFTIFISSGDTTDLGKDVQIEIQLTDTDGHNFTILKDSIDLKKQQISWINTTD